MKINVNKIPIDKQRQKRLNLHKYVCEWRRFWSLKACTVVVIISIIIKQINHYCKQAEEK